MRAFLPPICGRAPVASVGCPYAQTITMVGATTQLKLSARAVARQTIDVVASAPAFHCDLLPLCCRCPAGEQLGRYASALVSRGLARNGGMVPRFGRAV